MKFRKSEIAIFAAVLLCFLLPLYFLPQLPARFAIHWGISGQADGWADNPLFHFIPALASLFMLALFLALPRIDPLKANLAKFQAHYDALFFALIFFFLYLEVVTLAWNLGWQLNMGLALLPGFAFLFFVIGLVLEKSERNWFLGIRTPWTMSSDTVWRKTHQLGAKLFKAYALLLIVSLLFAAQLSRYFFYLVIIPILAIAFGLFVYSWRAYDQEQKAQGRPGKEKA